MAWRCPGARPLSELILVIFPTHICVIWPRWVEQKPVTENRDGHGHRRWQGYGTVLGERKTHTKAKYADTDDENKVTATTLHLAAAPKFVIPTTLFHTGAGRPRVSLSVLAGGVWGVFFWVFLVFLIRVLRQHVAIKTWNRHLFVHLKMLYSKAKAYDICAHYVFFSSWNMNEVSRALLCYGHTLLIHSGCIYPCSSGLLHWC